MIDKTYMGLHARARRIDEMVTSRCRKLAKEAGIDPSIFTLHAHNALVSLSQGKPWPGVNYAKVKRIKYLEQHRMFKGYDLVREYFARKNREMETC